MGSVKKIVTSALVLSGGTAVCAAEADAQVAGEHRLPDEDLEQLEAEMMEKALRHYANPLKHVQAEWKDTRLKDHVKYEIKAGDTLTGIANKFDIPLWEIVQENEIADRDHLVPGQILEIRLKEKSYRVQYGDTIDKIAEEHGVTLEELLAYNAVLRTTNETIYPGQELKIPTAPPEPIHQPMLTPKERGQTRLASAGQSQQTITAEKEEQSDTAAEETDAKPNSEESSDGASPSAETVQADASSVGLIWPLQGTLTSEYGPRWGRMHNGIDISHQDQDAPILAAGSGVVRDAYHHSGGYGNLVTIDHGGGYETYYAHLSRIKVQEGQQVNQGEVLGLMGQTGNATGSHVHFELRINNKPVNPLEYLP